MLRRRIWLIKRALEYPLSSMIEQDHGYISSISPSQIIVNHSASYLYISISGNSSLCQSHARTIWPILYIFSFYSPTLFLPHLSPLPVTGVRGLHILHRGSVSGRSMDHERHRIYAGRLQAPLVGVGRGWWSSILFLPPTEREWCLW